MNHRLTGSESHLHQLRGAAEPHDADVDAAIHQIDERVLEKTENHAAMVALYFMDYNFGRVHQTLRVTQPWKARSQITYGQSRKL
jgi:hypothetical protein